MFDDLSSIWASSSRLISWVPEWLDVDVHDVGIGSAVGGYVGFLVVPVEACGATAATLVLRGYEGTPKGSLAPRAGAAVKGKHDPFKPAALAGVVEAMVQRLAHSCFIGPQARRVESQCRQRPAQSQVPFISHETPSAKAAVSPLSAQTKNARSTNETIATWRARRDWRGVGDLTIGRPPARSAHPRPRGPLGLAVYSRMARSSSWPRAVSLHAFGAPLR